MTTEDPRKAWPPELIELSIMEEVHRLGFIFKYNFVEEPAFPGSHELAVGGACRCIALVESVLDAARLPAPLRLALGAAIEAFGASPRPLPRPMVDRLWQATIACLLRDRPPLPRSARDYQGRIRRLEQRPWIGQRARSIARGWLPICERAVRVAEASIPAAALERASTAMLAEKFGKLDWGVAGPDRRVDAAPGYVRTATRFACMACGRQGMADQGPRPGMRILTLCAAHSRLRRQDERAFQHALYPGGN